MYVCVCVLFQLVSRGVGGVQPELRGRGADAAGPVRPEDRPEQRGHPGRPQVCPAVPGEEAGLQRAQLPARLEPRPLVTGEHVCLRVC